MSTIIYVVIFFVVFYAVAIFWWRSQRNKSKNAFSNLDLGQEARNAPLYQQELLNADYAFLKKQMNSAPIDAFTTAASEYTATDRAKDLGKDALKSIATLGTVKFTTVTTPKYLALSGNELHLFDTDKDGNIDKHLVFDSSRLQQSTFSEIPLTGSSWKHIKYGDYALKSYKLELSTDGKPVTLILYSGLVNVSANNAAFLSMNAGKQVQEFVVGNYFLNKLGERYPNLKTSSYLPTA
ncbi:hypothetical protein [Niabella beijingensis]|uniref:hypothetical protein n=1 Tax=Niabella beijingensis TaxID=2872700 RepID=UPI001CBD7A7B|nr:hypothetical protein [Niabella beijingensis]MBZ4189466.1 hypothetical protein [Niabella beijingensis]